MSATKQPETAETLKARIIEPVTAERKRIDDGVDETMAAIDREAAKHAEQMARWQAQVTEAHAAFRPAPPPPTPRDMSGHTALLHRAVTARGHCTNWEQKLLGEYLPQIEAAYRHASKDLLDRTRRTPLSDVEELLPEWNGWLSLLAEARGAAGRAGGLMPHNPVPERMRKVIRGKDLLDAIGGVDLTAASEIPFLDRPTRDVVARDPDGPNGITREQAADDRRARQFGSSIGGGRF
jgi:hypothetical protein